MSIGMDGWEEAYATDAIDVPEGTMKGVEVESEPFVIFNLDGTFHAYRDRCPHQGARMSCGVITGAMLAGPREEGYRYGLEGQVISCPRHHWKFLIETGESLYATDRRRLLTVPVRVESGRIYLGIRRRARVQPDVAASS